MKYLTKIFSLLLISLTTLPAMAQRTEKVLEQLYQQERQAYLAKSLFVENGSTADWDLTYNRLEFFVDPAEQYIEGNVHFHFTSLKDNLNTLVIDLDDSLAVTSIVAGNTPCTYTHAAGFIHLTLPSTLQKKDTGSFTISYKGSPTITGIDARRFEFTWVSASEGQRWQHVVTEFTRRIHELGPAPSFNPVSEVDWNTLAVQASQGQGCPCHG